MNARWQWRTVAVLVPALAVGARLFAQQPAADSAAARPLADRATLEAQAARLEAESGRDAALEAERIRLRLQQGDFHTGDRVLIWVQGESTLSDTFTVTPQRTLLLPSPVVGELPLTGVLRAELEPQVDHFVRRFVHSPVVRARPLLRLSVQGEVAHGGYYDVAADLVLADVVMAAGGTTQNADVHKLRIERNGQRIWQGRALQQAMADGRTIDDASLRDGDLVVVPRRRQGSLRESLGFTWIVVSITATVYTLARR